MKTNLISLKQLGLYLVLTAGYNANAQSATSTTTITGDLRVNRDFESAGEVVALDTMRAKKDAIIDGNAAVGGNFKVNGEVFFNSVLNLSKNFGIQHTPATATEPDIISFSRFNGRSISGSGPKRTTGCTTFNVSTVNTFNDLLQVNNTLGTTLSMGIQNDEGIISLENGNLSQTGTQELSINPRCPNHINMGWGGGFVTVARNLEIGQKVRDNTVAFNIVPVAGIYKAININYQNSNVFEILSNGVTHIGTQRVTSRPGSMLTVAGEIDCKALYVLKPTTWQDRVFSGTYKLPSLNEVENFIIENKHLPGIKSEKDIMENGYDVNEVDAALLEKIENLYLYVIKQEKEIEALKKQVSEFSANH